MKKRFLNITGAIIFSLIISFPIVVPYLHRGYFPTHDGEWAIVRLADMFRELKDFQFPARYSGNLNFGYGYPLFNFTYPFPYYLGITLHIFGIGFVDSIKLLFALSIPISILFMFLASYELWENKLSGFISAILYAYFPYRMVDLYVRGSLGESISLILFPFIIFLIIKIYKKNHILLWCIGALSYATLIMTHNIMAVFFSLIIFGFVTFFYFENKKTLKYYLYFILFGLLMSSFFWLPAIIEKQYIWLSQNPIADRSLYYATLKQLLFSGWGYGIPTESNAFSYQLGLPHVILYVFTLIFVAVNLLKKKSKDIYLRQAFFISLLILSAVFLLFRQSAFLWKLPFLSEINYPWTMLAPLGFLLSLSAGYLCTKMGIIKYLVIIISIISVLIYLPYAKPKFYIDKGDNYYLTNDATTTSSQELMPLWVKNIPSERPKEKAEILQGKLEISNLFYNSKKLVFNTKALTDGILRINIIYYPGWKVFINGKESNIDYYNKKGVMDIRIKRGENNVSLIFSDTPIRLISNVLSLISLFILIVLSLKAKINYGKN